MKIRQAICSRKYRGRRNPKGVSQRRWRAMLRQLSLLHQPGNTLLREQAVEGFAWRPKYTNPHDIGSKA